MVGFRIDGTTKIFRLEGIIANRVPCGVVTISISSSMFAASGLNPVLYFCHVIRHSISSRTKTRTRGYETLPCRVGIIGSFQNGTALTFDALSSIQYPDQRSYITTTTTTAAAVAVVVAVTAVVRDPDRMHDHKTGKRIGQK